MLQLYLKIFGLGGSTKYWVVLACTLHPNFSKHFLNWYFLHGQFVREIRVHFENPPIAPYSTDVAICMWWFYCPRVGGYEIAAIESERFGGILDGGRYSAIQCTVA